MSRKIFSILFVTLLILHSCIKKDDKTVDEYRNIHTDTCYLKKSIDSLNNLAWEYLNINSDSSIIIINSALLISEKSNYKAGLALSLNQKGIIFYYTDKYDSATYYFNRAKEIAYKLKLKKKLASIYNNMALVSNIECKFDSTLSYNFNALSLWEEFNDSANIAKSLNNIGMAYYSMNVFNKALDYYNKSLSIKKRLNDLDDIASTLNNMGLIFLEKGIQLDEQYLDSSITYHKKALLYREETGNTRGIGQSYINLGNSYVEKQNDIEALNYFYKALAIFKKLDDPSETALIHYNIGCIYLNSKKYKQAEKSYLQCLKTAQEINNTDLLKDVYNLLAKLYSNTGYFKKAYHFSRLYNQLYDSIFTKENLRKIEEISLKYTLQKEQNKLLVAKSDIIILKLKQKRYIITIYLILTILIFTVAMLILRSLYKNKNYNKILENQINIIDYKNQLLLDNLKYAKVIQNAFLPSHSLFQKIFPDSFIITMPKNYVNGDFIWYYNTKKYKVVALVDCTGHGVPASLLSIIGTYLLDIIVKEFGLVKPSRVLENLNILIKKQFENGLGDTEIVESMDVALCYFYDSHLVYSGAYMPIIVESKGKCTLYKGDKIPLGGYAVKRQEKYSEISIPILKGDKVYLFTDGFYDQFGGPKGRPTHIKNLVNLVADCQSLSIFAQKEYFETYLKNWMKGYEQIDDITLVGIKID